MIRKVAIVSLSSGTIGEKFVRHEVEIGKSRLRSFGLDVVFMSHALSGISYVKEHPEKRAEDLLAAFSDPSIDFILCAIGGDDTYRLSPFLLENDALKKVVKNKIFLGFSDTTINHFMLRKVGLKTFYGQSFLADVCELDVDMLPYSKRYFAELIETGRIREVRPSEVWYESRTDFGMDQIGTPLSSHPDRGFLSLQGAPVFSGEILGGCVDSIYDLFYGDRYEDMPVLNQKYGLFPTVEEWKGKILLLESSEEEMSPKKYEKTLKTLLDYGVFDVVSGVLVGKPMDERYQSEYETVLCNLLGGRDLPIVTNVNVGHAQPRCILPLGVPATVDVSNQVIRFS